MKHQNKPPYFWLWISVVAVIVDQYSKHLVLQYLLYDAPFHVLAFLNVTLRLNTGAAFSFLDSVNGWQVPVLAAVSIIVSLWLLIWLFYIKRQKWMLSVSLCLILGGALGNLIDRLQYGYVVDFIDFHVGTWHFATFNIADSAISVGAFFVIMKLAYESFVGKSQRFLRRC